MTRVGWMVLATALAARPAAAQIKIAYIDPLSGPFANVGEQGVAHFQGAIERVNAAGGVLGGQKLELVTFDNKGSPQESLIAFQAATDQGIRFITQGNGSGVAGALVDAVNKHNARNPDKAVLYLNYAAVDPDLTGVKCSFWHFRFDANTNQKLAGITDYLAKQKDIHKVYILGQDYAHGHQISRVAPAMLKEKRPDITVVGNDLHPMGKVKDFAPYVAKIKSSGADAVITGNWGNDLSLLVKAARDAGLKTRFYTYYAGGLGTPTAIGDAGTDRVLQISEWHNNMEGNKSEAYARDFKKKYKMDFYYQRVNTEVFMLAKALDGAKSADPKQVALALEGMRYASDAGEVWMRKEDHQLVQPLFISVFSKLDGSAVRNEVESTGHGFRTVAAIAAKDTELPSSCQMQRP